MKRIAHLVGPGGAGKTTVGRCLAEQLRWGFVDLDHAFMLRHGDIAGYIADHGYAGYAKANVKVYEDTAGASLEPAVFALSSGFMVYPGAIDDGYEALRGAIERHPLTVLLLPAFDLDECCRLIVERQLSRPYLRGDRAAEHARIRERFPAFMALRCKRFLSNEAQELVAGRIVRALCAAEPAATELLPDVSSDPG